MRWWPKRGRVLAALALAFVAVLATAAGGWTALTTGEDAAAASWSLLGVADGGRALRIKGPDHGACDRVTVDVEESAERIVVSAAIRTPRGAYSCVAMLIAGPEVTVALDAPVAGRTVTGPKKVLRPPPYRLPGGPHATGPPRRPLPVPAVRPPWSADPARVVGLRYRDARDALCNDGFQARPAPRGTGRGTVVAQRPPRRQPRTGRPRYPTCTNGMLPAVDVVTRAP